MIEEGRELMTGIYKKRLFRNKYYFINKPYDDTATALEDTSVFPKLNLMNYCDYILIQEKFKDIIK
jgi:hypothetical protein